jgi:hypothetical protein
VILFFKTAGFNRSPTPPFAILTYCEDYGEIRYTWNLQCCILVQGVACSGGPSKMPTGIRQNLSLELQDYDLWIRP